MAVHAHSNQVFLNRLGIAVGSNYAYLTYAGNQPDGRFWTRDKGVCAADGTPLMWVTDPDTGISSPQVLPIRFSNQRVAPNGTVYTREILIDSAGLIVEVGPEKLLAKPTGTNIFQQYGPDGIIPIAGSAIGASDEFFTRDGRGLAANVGFEADAETIFMKANGTDIQLKPLVGEAPAAGAWDDVAASYIGSLYCMSTDIKLYGRQYGEIPLPDGVAVELGTRVLVDQQLRPQENGIYSVTKLGGADETWELTRTSDANTPDKFILNREVTITGGVIRGGQTMYLITEVEVLGMSEVSFEIKQ